MNYIVNLNKPPEITSQQAVTRVKRLLGVEKAGHTGTLDPLATGILLVCLNEATKVSRFLLNMDKKYKARIKLGERTDTYDATGRIIDRKDISSLKEAELMDAVEVFKGSIKQKPPMYSAVKVAGETLYKLARKGIEVERPERIVEIYDIKIVGIDLPYCDMTISCSKGTYVRTICDDIGRNIGVGAHLVALERTAIGFFDLRDAVSLEDLSSYKKNSCGPDKYCVDDSRVPGEKTGDCGVFPHAPAGRCFYSIDLALSGLKEIFLSEHDYRRALQGMPIISHEISELADDVFVRMKGPSGNLFAIGRIYSGLIRIERMLNLSIDPLKC
jgi:tRNA pseudouridine55 synthase